MEIKHADLLLSTQHALLGRIGNSVLGICIKEQDLVIEMTVYTDGEASEEQREELDEGLAEIVSDFPWLSRIDIHFHSPLPNNGYPRSGHGYFFGCTCG